jgi:D-aminoacyl-tRNA deacylase
VFLPGGTFESGVIGIVVSRADSASEHIAAHLRALADWREREDDTREDAAGGGQYHRTDGFEMRTFDDIHLELDDAAAAFEDPSMLVFASRHSGETGPLLTAHFTGNFGPAEFGGESGRFARAAPNALAAVLEALDEHAPPNYDTGIECTHHGPTGVDVPSMFVELGSGESEWRDPAGAKAVARAILSLSDVEPERSRQVVGFGGGHYAPRFERVVRETDWAVGHVGADWALAEMGDPAAHRDVLDRAFARSGARHALLDDDRERLAALVEELGYRVVSETWLRETDGVDLGVVEALESRLSTVEAGLRFGAPAAACRDPETLTTLSLPAELLSEAQGIDSEATREAVRDHLVAFETTEGGTRARGRAVVSDPDDADALVDALVGVLGEKYDDVRREAATVVARETAFDPAAARELGVPEGPAFGRLSNGESVTVDDRRVTPEQVSRERTVRFRIND